MSAPEFYTRVARLYDALARRGPFVGGLREALADALDPGPGATVVEFGCGTGANRPYVEAAVGDGGTYVGVDFAPGVLRVARERGRARDDDPGAFVRGDATRPPLRDDRIDACFGAFVTGMLPDPAAAVRTWADLVGPGGRVALLDLARTTRSWWRALNPAFRLFVRAGSPPGTARSLERSPAAVQDGRVAAAHRALRDVCADATYRTLLGGFARVSAGTVE
ncbi:class I SAM-dependent methyltransferase [Halobaculum sp. EA56]|uniref:class I SAM-dependent methyltransferase n=1 Tax=Halobaculum sp. EA56 TaxID=3421648 RepID=UPI003EB6D6C9